MIVFLCVVQEGYNWCLASGDGCGGEGLYDAIQCINCNNAVIDKAHVPTWKGRMKLLMN